MVVGEANKGKTSLLLNLTRRGKVNHYKEVQMSHNNVPLATVGVDLGDWEYAPRNKNKITFMTWDFGGQEEYYATHQCFLTKRSLYLLVWNVEDREYGTRNLKSWLENIQACARNSPVIILGTHVDTVPASERSQLVQRYNQRIRELYVDHESSRYRYPTIQGIHFVNCHDSKDMDRMRENIYNLASVHKTSGRYMYINNHK